MAPRSPTASAARWASTASPPRTRWPSWRRCSRAGSRTRRDAEQRHLAETEAQRFRAGALAILISGPWAYPALGTVDGGRLGGLAIDPLPGAPRGAQLLVVPRCAAAPARAWALAAALTAPTVQAAWSTRLGMVPTTTEGLAAASPLARATYAALTTARPLPRHRLTPGLFDDLSPAVAAVVAGDATPAEAMAGVRRAWTRALAQEATP